MRSCVLHPQDSSLRSFQCMQSFGFLWEDITTPSVASPVRRQPIMSQRLCVKPGLVIHPLSELFAFSGPFRRGSLRCSSLAIGSWIESIRSARSRFAVRLGVACIKASAFHCKDGVSRGIHHYVPISLWAGFQLSRKTLRFEMFRASLERASLIPSVANSAAI